MDSIVDYLIVLFFIISFLSSVFKKKKKQIAKEEDKKQRPIAEMQIENAQKNKIVSEKSKTVNKPSFENILKAMLQVPEPTEDQKSEVDAYYEEALKKSAIINHEKESLIPATDESHRVLINEDKSSSYIDAMKKIKKKHISQKAIMIKENLNNISTIKDYIVMNEILGKPIALKE